MLSLLQSVAFLNPWLLLALGILPALWFLLRVLPPAPTHIRFPAIRLLFGLESDEKAPISTPWPLILLRLLIAALIILGVSHPVLNPGTALKEDGPLFLIIDNDWAAAGDWDRRIDILQDAVAQAEREGKTVRIITTAPEAEAPGASITETDNPGTDSPGPYSFGTGVGLRDYGALRPAEAAEILATLTPRPWEGSREAALELAEAILSPNTDEESALETSQDTPTILYATNGLHSPSLDLLLSTLAEVGPVTVLAPGFGDETTAVETGPLTLVLKETDFAQVSFTVSRASAVLAETEAFIARGENGRALARAEAVFGPGMHETTLVFALPTELQNQVTSVTPERLRGAGATTLLDARWRRRPVGLIDMASMDVGPALLSESYFVRNALEPISQLSQGPVDLLLSTAQSVIVAPDSVALEPTEIETLDQWVQEGGVLLRFAGPRLAASRADGQADGQGDSISENVSAGDPLIPVRLRAGGRVLGGAMVWSEPLAISAFNPESPLKDLSTTTDTRVSRQVLAEPAPDLDRKTWARLSDGTPIVTADRRGEGWVVLVHTTANTDWSTLALSGLFVDLLERVVDMSRGVIGLDGSGTLLLPERVLDGFGKLSAPGPFVAAIDGEILETTVLGPTTPPGIYAQGRMKRALNLGPSIEPPLSEREWIDSNTLATLPSGVTVQPYALGNAIDLKGTMLAAALCLFLIDIFVSLWLRGYLTWIRVQRLTPTALSRSALGLLALVTICAAIPFVTATGSKAQVLPQGKDADILAALSGTTFAYVITGDARTDEISRAGLLGLSMTLQQRTAVEAVDPIGVDLRQDQIHFFPLLYWPITETQPPLNALAVERLNDFMATGGTILFDTRSQATGGVDPGASIALRRLSRGLEIPALAPIPPEHVLTKSFYLMQEFPGRWAGGQLWVETEENAINDGVSRVIVGGGDWAGAWAIDPYGDPILPVAPGGERQREMAYRFGVNLAMYILTGNYKADQVHIPSILERLGQ